jgi:LysM repeat protein/ABC-type branched-subunit amino acid transport system substrate-binding protein
LITASAFSQESTDIHKTRSSAIIGGVKYYLHTVEKGQTLFAIAKFYGRDVNDIVIENPDAIDGIKPGQVLRIPVEKKKITELSVNDTSNYIIHKVEKGQTLYSITKQYGISDEKLRLLNPELKDGLKLGQSLKIPSVKPKTNPVNVVSSTVTNSAVKPDSAAKTNEAADRSVLPTVYSGEKKEEYNVAFFLPFHADEANRLDPEKLIKGDEQLSGKTNVALQFYEGALLAFDSLKRAGLKMKVFVYDVDDHDSMNIINLLKKPELAEMDLMIGPLYGSSFMPVAKFAKEHQIAIVSPLTQVNKILFNNPYVCKLSPSATLQVEQMAHFVVDSFSTYNLILVNNQNVKDAAFFNAFRKTAAEAMIAAGKAPADSVRIATGIASVQSMLSSVKTNVVILPSNNQSYVSDFISKLNMMGDKNKIILCGLQAWATYDNLDFEYLNRLSLHIPSNTYLDYENASTSAFINSYRSQFKTEPEIYAFQGFDATCFFLQQLSRNGTGFLSNLQNETFNGLESRYLFKQFPSDSGFENKFVFMLKYQDYKLVKAN